LYSLFQVVIIADHKFVHYSAAHTFETEENKFVASLTSSDQAALTETTAASSLFPSEPAAPKPSSLSRLIGIAGNANALTAPRVAQLQVAITEIVNLEYVKSASVARTSRWRVRNLTTCLCC